MYTCIGMCGHGHVHVFICLAMDWYMYSHVWWRARTCIYRPSHGRVHVFTCVVTGAYIVFTYCCQRCLHCSRRKKHVVLEVFNVLPTQTEEPFIILLIDEKLDNFKTKSAKSAKARHIRAGRDATFVLI